MEQLPAVDKPAQVAKPDERSARKPDVRVTKVDVDNRAVFDFGSDDDDDSTADDDVEKEPETACPVTLINTLLNANMHQTSEGDAIRKQLAADPGKTDDPGKTEDPDDKLTLSSSESRLFAETHPILTVEPPSPMPSFSLPEPLSCFGDVTNADLALTASQSSIADAAYGGLNNLSSSSRRALPCDTNSGVTFSRKRVTPDASPRLTARIPSSFVPPSNTCSCHADTNKNKLTVPAIFDLVSHNLNKLAGERKACQRSHSTCGHGERRKVPAECSVRCASLSPANSFRAVLTKRPINPSAAGPAPTAPPLASSAFHRSLETELGYPAFLQKLEDMQRSGTAQDLEPNRPSPDQDLGCSPRGRGFSSNQRDIL
jgi:hypothetical protein